MKTVVSAKTGLMAVCLAALTVIPAVIHGRLTNRWVEPADVQQAAALLDAFPSEFGEWRQSGPTEELSAEIVRELQCKGYLSRRYVNRTTGDEILAMVMVGTPGPLVRHPPEICYGNRANTLVRDPQDMLFRSSDQVEHTLRVLRYRAPGEVASEFSIVYGWSTGGTWSVPDFPRFEFGAQPLLYKLQLLSSGPPPDDGELAPAVTSFLNDFLPQLNTDVFAAGAADAESKG